MKKVGKYFVSIVVFCILLRTVPVWWCQRHVDDFYNPSFEMCKMMADGAFESIQHMNKSSFDTGSTLFNGEWLFGSNTMAALGNAQVALQYPAYQEVALPRMRSCFDNLLSQEVQAFNSAQWNGQNAIENLANDEDDHAAYLGYFNLPLSLYNHIRTNLVKAPDKDKYQRLNEQITAALVRRMQKRPNMLLETYPTEFYPVDNASCAASIAVYSKAFDKYTDTVKKWGNNFNLFIDPKTDMLIQSVNADMTHYSQPRGSGSALAAYFLIYLDTRLSKRLYKGCKTELFDKPLGFGLMNEYPEAFKHMKGDIDSGPLIWGYSMSATGFSLAAAKAHNDQTLFATLFATAWVAGAPELKGKRLHWKTGGPLGDTIMFAMLTAPKTFNPKKEVN